MRNDLQHTWSEGYTSSPSLHTEKQEDAWYPPPLACRPRRSPLSRGHNLVQRAMRAVFLMLVIVASVVPLHLYGGTTGKIAGVVKEATTGEPLAGCNIVIEGTTQGAATDVDGNYFILNVPPGRYVLRATIVGYSPYKVTNIQVVVDLTTKVDFLMKQTTQEMAEVVVSAERPLFEHDVTSKRSTVTSEEILNMPVTSVQDVLMTKAGFTMDANGNIHVRGGRAGEIGYMIDGMYIMDPLSGGYDVTMNKDAIEEMIVLTGTFNAEYGDAMSSIVNIVTKEGGESFHGKVEYVSPMLNESKYRRQNAFAGVQDSYTYTEKSVTDGMEFALFPLEIPMEGTLNVSLSGPLPGVSDLTFFASGRYKNENSYLPHGYDMERDAFGKLAYRFSPAFKVAVSGQTTTHQYQLYDHAWKYLSNNQSHTENTTDRLSLTVTHAPSSKLFYTAQLSWFDNTVKIQVGDKVPQEYVRGQTGETVYFYVKGDDALYADNRTTTTTGKFDITFQADNVNQLKAGLEFRSHHISAYEESEPWPSGAQYKDSYRRTPIEGAAYLQDKIEYDFLIVNLGLRFDYADPELRCGPTSGASVHTTPTTSGYPLQKRKSLRRCS